MALEKYLNEGDKKIRKYLNLYNKFEDMKINFVDLYDYRHNDEYDLLSVKVSVTGIGEKGKRYTDGIKEQFTDVYTIEFKKINKNELRLI